FVDFFFVLSGFVIAANYQQRLLEGFGARRFLLLRLGRLYPLHFAMLALFIAFWLLKRWVSSTAPLGGPNEAPDTIVANLLVVHGLHLFDFLTWNVPSGSISTEFYPYAVFAVCLIALRRRAWLALVLAMIGGPVLIAALSGHAMNTHYDWGFVRCLYGFAA